MAEVIAFVSGKGGMGKTALCAAVGTALAGKLYKVLCIDCDDVWGDLDMYLALSGENHLTYADIATGRYGLDRVTSYDVPGLRFLAAPAVQERVEAEAFDALLRHARQQFDYILLDNPRQDFAADRYIVVTTPTRAAVRAARRMADRLEVQGKTNVRLIINQVDQKKLTMDMDDIIDAVGLQLIGLVPKGRRMTDACQRIAGRIAGEHTAIPRRL